MQRDIFMLRTLFFFWHGKKSGLENAVERTKKKSHESATSTPGAPLRALAVPAPAFAGFLVVDEVLGFDGHVHDVRGGAEGEFAICRYGLS